MTIGLNHRPYTDGIADRLWELHAAGLRGMSRESLANFVEQTTAALLPGTGEITAIVERLQQRQRDNARPPDGPEAVEDPYERLFR